MKVHSLNAVARAAARFTMLSSLALITMQATAIELAPAGPNATAATAVQQRPNAARMAAAAALASTQLSAAPSPFPGVLALVLTRDPQVRSAREALKVAVAQKGQVFSRFFPSIGVSTNYGRSHEMELGSPVNRYNNRTEGFLRWNLFNGGADQNQLNAADRERVASVADLQRSLDEACERTVEAYFDWLRLTQQVVRADQRVIEITTLADRVQKQWIGGKATEGDAQLAASSLIDSQFSRDSLIADRNGARVKIETLAGQPLGSPVSWTLPAAAGIDSRFDMPFDDAVAQARIGNGQWRAAEERAEAARLRIGLIAPEYLPKVDLDVRKTLSDTTNPQIDPAQHSAWTFQLTYEIPLGGEVNAKRDELKARTNGALADAEKVGQDIRGNLAVARYRGEQALAAFDPIQRQVHYLQEVVRTSEMQYEAGRRNLLNLIQLRDQRFQIEQRSFDNDYRMLTSQSQWLALSGALADTLGVKVPEDAATPVPAPVDHADMAR